MRKLVLMIAVLATGLLLGSCGDGGGSSRGAEPPDQVRDEPASVPDNPSVPDEPTSTSPAAPPRPSVPESFEIRGTWKSVGSTGWGQAQPGAIILFAEGQANLYSPQDTYAFYKDTSGYRLDVTGLLGGSSSFRVTIVDNDNIELYSGSGSSAMVVLKRLG